jgi:hypothetical protein
MLILPKITSPEEFLKTANSQMNGFLTAAEEDSL